MLFGLHLLWIVLWSVRRNSSLKWKEGGGSLSKTWRRQSKGKEPSWCNEPKWAHREAFWLFLVHQMNWWGFSRLLAEWWLPPAGSKQLSVTQSRQITHTHHRRQSKQLCFLVSAKKASPLCFMSAAKLGPPAAEGWGPSHTLQVSQQFGRKPRILLSSANWTLWKRLYLQERGQDCSPSSSLCSVKTRIWNYAHTHPVSFFDNVKHGKESSSNTSDLRRIMLSEGNTLCLADVHKHKEEGKKATSVTFHSGGINKSRERVFYGSQSFAICM